MRSERLLRWARRLTDGAGRALQPCTPLLATQDPLTGLDDAATFDLRLEELLAQGVSVVVVVCAVDGLPPAAQPGGGPTSDAVLLAVAMRLRAAVRADDPVARVGDHRFAALVASYDSAAARAQLENRLATVFALPLTLPGAAEQALADRATVHLGISTSDDLEPATAAGLVAAAAARLPRRTPTESRAQR